MLSCSADSPAHVANSSSRPLWTALLDAPAETLYELAAVASQRGRIDLRRGSESM